MKGHAAIVRLLIAAGADVHAVTESDESSLFVATAHGRTQVIRQLIDAGARVQEQWMGLTAVDAAEVMRHGSTLDTLRAHESEFMGRVLDKRGCKCVASWPGIYARQWVSGSAWHRQVQTYCCEF